MAELSRGSSPQLCDAFKKILIVDWQLTQQLHRCLCIEQRLDGCLCLLNPWQFHATVAWCSGVVLVI
ncbi:hypothetical protein HNY73_007385 [Argiope bruennichi]|uniref:Uncharacterized protein n=1 Tax=Argiope bruennichi TaxID=94029 RepID=A0A8T0FDS5_ARGBR|nr:hypothetical protein HNY73_007385 [Argiope bruennichi]